MNSSESPGRKKPISSPDSAKMIAISPIVPNVRMSSSGDRLRARTCTTFDPRVPAPAGAIHASRRE